jgi:lambda repressor-like predicted transcriptional regulator
MQIRHLILTTTAASLLVSTLGFAATLGNGTAWANPTPSEGTVSLELAQRGNPSTQGSQRGANRRGQHLATAAAELGVSETELRTALGLPEQPIEPDFAGAAAQLGTTETELRNALRSSHQAGPGPGGRRPDFAAVAQQYGVSTETLLSALGVPAERPQPDIAAAAQQLGVSEDVLRDALRPNRRCD